MVHVCPKCQKYIHAFHGYDINNSIKFITCAKCHYQTGPFESSNSSTINMCSIQSEKTPLANAHTFHNVFPSPSSEQAFPKNCNGRLEIILSPELGTQRKRAGQPITYSFSLEEGFDVFMVKTKNTFNQNLKKEELKLQFNGKKVYMKRSVKQKMTDLTALSEENFITTLKHTWKNHHLWKKVNLLKWLP